MKRLFRTLNIFHILELCAKYLKEGPNLEFGPTLRALSTKSSLACFVLEPDVESWVKLLRHFFSISNGSQMEIV